MIPRILIAADFLMTSEEEQRSNLRWLVDLLSRPIERATGIHCEAFVGGTSDHDAVDRQRFFALSGIEVDPFATQFHFEPREIGRESRRYLADRLALAGGAVLVGYELSEQTRELLTDAGVHYVDIWLHPVRYLDDILFAFSSNHPEVFARLAARSLDPEHFRLYADRYRVATYKGYKRISRTIAPNSALFVGQTLSDKAICHHETGRMLTLLDYKREFEAAGSRYSTIYYSRHPFVKTGDQATLEYVSSCGFAQVVDWPAYELLAQPNLEHVFSISSSLVHEAAFFGKDVAFLYRPVIEFGQDFGPRTYTSVYQEFVSGHFWSDVLSPLVPTREAPRVMFLDPKDKLRDTLGFYWSYRHVDKTEAIRAQLNAVDRKLQSIDARTQPPKTRRSEPARVPDPSTDWSSLVDQLKRAAVVSFDIFDTLLVRPLAEPADVFALMSKRAEEISGGAVQDFPSARLAARGWVRNGAHGEEVTLSERYEAIRARFDLTQDARDALLRLELDVERDLLRRREFGCRLLAEAIRLGKRVVLISDTYLECEFVEEVLSRHDIAGWEKAYLSSEIGLLKSSGRLFEHVLADLRVSPSSMLHIGDNVRSDIEVPSAAGIRTLHLPRTIEAARHSTSSVPHLRCTSPIATSMLQGLVANQIADNPFGIESPSFAGGGAERLGYCVVGPLFLGFARWILRNATSAGVEHLYFLARDGAGVMDAYEQLRALVPDAPRATYALASRRALSIAALRSVDDVVRLLDNNFSPVPLERLLRNRFGIDAARVDDRVFQDHGFADSRALVEFKADQRRLRGLARAIAPVVLENASEERALLLEYYREIGLTDRSTRKAVVDIGHHGSLQRALSRLLDDRAVGGYYFALFDGAAHLGRAGLRASAYAGDALAAGRSHPYVRRLLMFELLFLNEHGSFVRMMRANGRSTPEMLDVRGEAARVTLARQLHGGAARFVRDAVSQFGPRLLTIPLSATDVVRPYCGMLDAPSAVDARDFVGVALENVYSGRDVQFVVAPSGDSKTSLWQEGAAAIAAWNASTAPSRSREQGAGDPPELAPTPAPTRAAIQPRTPSGHSGASEARVTRASSNGVHAAVAPPVRADGARSKDERRVRQGESLALALGEIGYVLGIVSDRKRRKLRRSPQRFFAESKNRLVRRLAGWIDDGSN